jgi:L-aminoadipate-semialdehyde dehydrogenase
MPVDGVSRIVVAAAASPPEELELLNSTNRSMSFDTYLSVLEDYGYDVQKVSYDIWKAKLEDYVTTTAETKREEHALLPLYHLAVTDLPNDSRSPALGTRNMRAVVKAYAAHAKVDVADKLTEDLVAKYLSYLCEIGFLERPVNGKGKKALPKVEIGAEQRDALAKIGGRGAIAS